MENSVVSGRGHQGGSEYAIIFGFDDEFVDLEPKWGQNGASCASFAVIYY